MVPRVRIKAFDSCEARTTSGWERWSRERFWVDSEQTVVNEVFSSVSMRRIRTSNARKARPPKEFPVSPTRKKNLKRVKRK